MFFAALNNGNGNGGLILGVNDLAAGAQDVGMLDALMMPQTGIPANGRHPQQVRLPQLSNDPRTHLRTPTSILPEAILAKHCNNNIRISPVLS